MATESELRGLIRGLEQEYEDASRNNARIQEKIDALEQAKEKIKLAKDRAEDLKRAFDRYEPNDRWAGKRFDRFDAARNALAVRDVENYIEAIEGLKDEVSSEIARLWFEKNHIVEFLNGCESTLGNLYDGLKDLLSGK